jgi:probable O-glycosylation ligase (exosortase A-associated)
MPVRDIVLTMVIVTILPFAVRYTWVGVLLWTWISIMNPHRMTYGFAFDAPFALLAAGATLLSLFFGQDKKSFPWSMPVITLLCFVVWMGITTLFAQYPAPSWVQLEKVLKIQLMTLVALAAIRERLHIELFVWVNALSIAFFGFKGGIFTIAGGGSQRVWGPPGGFIGGNNEIGLAMVMVIPLLNYLRMVSPSRWVRAGLILTMLLTGIAVLGTQSRGALLAIAAMAVVMWWRSHRRVVGFVVMGVIATAMVSFMPETWEARMNTIVNYQEDGSALGRINAWTMAFNLANDRFTGAGFESVSYENFVKYAIVPEPRAAHSIYFQVLGEHGWVGLGLFLSIGFFTLLLAAKVRRRARAQAGAEWLDPLAGMIQVSMVGYAVGGAFLSLAYFDLPYNVLVILVAAWRWMQEERWKTETFGAFGASLPINRLPKKGRAATGPPPPPSPYVPPRVPPGGVPR